MERSLEKLLIMIVPTFVDLQGFIIHYWELVCCEGSGGAEKGEHSLALHFCKPWNVLTKSERSCASWLIANHHGLQWEAGMIPHMMARYLITSAIAEDDDTLVYVKGYKKRE